MLNHKKLDQYALLGNPVTHSLSPMIHHLFAQQTDQSLQYEAIHVPIHELDRALSTFQQHGGQGVNITAPFKQAVFSLVDSVTERAKNAQSINTILFSSDGKRHGDNTDGVGLIRDLTQNHAIQLEHKRILVLGSGGASYGILGPLLDQNPLEITISNRTESKEEEQVNYFSSQGNVTAQLSGSYDLIINTTAAPFEHFQQLPLAIIAEHTYCYDLVYSKTTTAFLQWAKQANVSWMKDGLGMLVEQAAEAFYLWRNVMPATQPILTILRTPLKLT